MGIDDLLGDLPDDTPPKKPRTVRPKAHNFASHLDDMGLMETAKITDRKDGRIAGNYFRKTFTLTQDQIEALEKLAQKWETSGNDVARWIVDVGLDAAANGQKPTLVKRGWRKVYER